MNNMYLPAFPIPNASATDENGNLTIPMNGFTKLEYASLLMMQGLTDSTDWDMASNDKAADLANRTAKTAVLLAKAVLEEANK